MAQMFVHMGTGQKGLVCMYDVVCFDEVSGVSFDKKDGVNIMKGYMESGEFSRGKENIRADGSLVFVGNFDVDVDMATQDLNIIIQEFICKGLLFEPEKK